MARREIKSVEAEPSDRAHSTAETSPWSPATRVSIANGDITTLGRGASDLTAVALAAALKADACEIYTDVDGVYHRRSQYLPAGAQARSHLL